MIANLSPRLFLPAGVLLALVVFLAVGLPVPGGGWKTQTASAQSAYFLRIECPQATVEEGESFTVRLTVHRAYFIRGASFDAQFSTDPGTAGTDDYHPQSGVYVSKSVTQGGLAYDYIEHTVRTKEDLIREGDETFTIRIYHPRTWVNGDRCTLTIRDDDFTPNLLAANTHPSGIWSDGTTTWVADRQDDKLYAYNIESAERIMPRQLQDFDTLADAGNNHPEGIWSDGTVMYVADGIDRKIYAYRMANKALWAAKEISLHADNARPRGIWSDGTTMWVADPEDRKVYAYRMADKERDPAKDITLPPTSAPNGLWSDGSAMWVGDLASGRLLAYTLTGDPRPGRDIVLQAANRSPEGIWSDGTTMRVLQNRSRQVYDYPLPSPPGVDLSRFHYNTSGIWSDGSTTWVSDWSADTIYAYAADGTRVEGKDITAPAAAGNGDPLGIWSDGTTMWAADWHDRKLYAYSMGTRMHLGVQGDIPLHADNARPLDIWSDGTTMWVADAEDGKVYAYNLATKAHDGAKDIRIRTDFGIWSDGGVIWTAEGASRYLRAYTLAGQRRPGLDIVLDAANTAPRGIWSDGTTMRVVQRNRVFAYPMQPGVALSLDASGITEEGGSQSVAATVVVRGGGNLPSNAAVSLSFAHRTTDDGDFTSKSIPAVSLGAADPALDFDTLTAAGNTDPYGIWSDGTTMWVSDDGDDKLFAYNLATRARDGDKDIGLTHGSPDETPRGIWSDGTTMWVADYSTSIPLSVGTVFAYTLATEARDNTKDIGLHNPRPAAVWSDGTIIYVQPALDLNFLAYRLSDKERVSALDVGTRSEGGTPRGLWSDGTTMWVAGAGSTGNKIYAYAIERVSDGSTRQGRIASLLNRDAGKDIPLRSGNDHPHGVWSDGTTMWVLDSEDDKLYAYHLPGRAGTTKRTVELTFEPSDDTDDEGRETFAVDATLALPATGESLSRRATLTISDDDEVGLVSNLAEASSSSGSLQTHDHAQQFTTGAYVRGYTLTGVDLDLTFAEGNRAAFSVAVHASSGGAPGALLATLTPPQTLSTGYNSFTHAGLDLHPSTSYFVVIDVTASGVGLAQKTESDDEGGAAGWSIGDGGHRRASGSTGAWEAGTASYMMRLRGSVKSPSVSSPPLRDLAVESGGWVTWKKGDPEATGYSYRIRWASHAGTLPSAADDSTRTLEPESSICRAEFCKWQLPGFDATRHYYVEVGDQAEGIHWLAAGYSPFPHSGMAARGNWLGPQRVRWEATHEGIAITWSPPADGQYDGFRVEGVAVSTNAQGNVVTHPYSDRSPQPQSVDLAGDARSFTKSGLASGQRYRYRVWTMHEGEPVWLEEILFMTRLAPAEATGAGLTAVPVPRSATELDLSWRPVDGAADYLVQWKTGDQAYSATERSRAIAYTAHRIEGLSAAASYMVKVTARLPDGSLGASREATGTTNAPPPPLSLTGLVVSHVDGEPGKLDVRWNPLPGADVYVVHWSGSASGDYSLSGASYRIDDNLLPGALHTVEVVAWERAGSGNAEIGRASVRIWTLAVLGDELRVTPVAGRHDALDVSWGAVPGALSYEVRWREESGGGERSAIVPGGTTTYRITGLIANTEYRVTASYSTSEGPGRSIISLATTNKAVVGLRVATNPVVTGELWVFWDNLPGAARYQFAYREGTVETRPFTDSRLVTRHSAGETIGGALNPATFYTVRVTALRADGTVMGSGEGGAWTRRVFEGVFANPVPGRGDQLEVTWPPLDPSLGEYRYTVSYKRTGTSDAWTSASNMATTPYVITGLVPNTGYTVRVQARWVVTGRFARSRLGANVVEAGEFEAYPTVTGDPPPVTQEPAPGAAPNLSVWNFPGTGASFDWVAVDSVSGRNVTGYTLQWSTAPGGTWTNADQSALTEKRCIPNMTYDTYGYQRDSDGQKFGGCMYEYGEGTAWAYGDTRYFRLVAHTSGADSLPGLMAKVKASGNPAPAGGESGEQEPAQGEGSAGLTGLTVASVAGEPAKLAVSWDAVESAVKYSVRWKTGSGSYGDAVETTRNSYTVTGLTAATTYTVNIAALDGENTLLGEATASGTTTARTGGQQGASGDSADEPAEPAALEGLTVSPVSGQTTRLAVSWNAVTDADKYVVRWKTGSGSYNSGEEATTNSHTVTGLSANTAYTVQVTAIDTGADPDLELAIGEAGGTTLAAMGTVTVTAVTGSGDSLDVSWPAVSGAVGYVVEWKTGGGSYSAVARPDATATSEQITGLSAETAYTVKVTARHTIGGATADGDSAEGSGTTNAAPADTPATGVPTISGTAQVGQELSADTSGIGDADGLANASFAYQWLADDAAISGATGSSYTPVAADAGKAISVRVSFTDDAGNAETLTSAATAAVAAEDPPAATPAASFVIYHDPDAGDAAVDRYNQGVKLLTDAGITYSEVSGDVQAEVDRLAGVTDSVLPRFFLGDPTEEGWVSKPRENNGGLRWLKEKVAELTGD